LVSHTSSRQVGVLSTPGRVNDRHIPTTDRYVVTPTSSRGVIYAQLIEMVSDPLLVEGMIYPLQIEMVSYTLQAEWVICPLLIDMVSYLLQAHKDIVKAVQKC